MSRKKNIKIALDEDLYSHVSMDAVEDSGSRGAVIRKILRKYYLLKERQPEEEKHADKA